VAGWLAVLERRQIGIYLAAVALATAVALAWPTATALSAAIDPALALMLFATFLQIPLSSLGRAFRPSRFLAALLAANFLVVPCLVLALQPLLPKDPLNKLFATAFGQQAAGCKARDAGRSYSAMPRSATPSGGRLLAKPFGAAPGGRSALLRGLWME